MHLPSTLYRQAHGPIRLFQGPVCTAALLSSSQLRRAVRSLIPTTIQFRQAIHPFYPLRTYFVRPTSTTVPFLHLETRWRAITLQSSRRQWLQKASTSKSWAPATRDLPHHSPPLVSGWCPSQTSPSPAPEGRRSAHTPGILFQTVSKCLKVSLCFPLPTLKIPTFGCCNSSNSEKKH